MFHLQRNLPVWERLLRACAGALLALAAWTVLPPGWPMTAAWTTAGVLAATAAIGFCPACAMLGRRPAKGGR